MANTEEIVNRVALSSLVTFDLEEHYPKGERIVLDIKDWLFNELILKEKDFRNYVKEHDWSFYQNKNVALTCSVDAIVPTWAYMLITTKLSPFANMVIYGDLPALELALFKSVLDNIDLDQFKDAKVVVKGCGNLPVPASAYVEITRLLTPVATSIMYGEPCSTVPLYKRKRIS